MIHTALMYIFMRHMDHMPLFHQKQRPTTVLSFLDEIVSSSGVNCQDRLKHKEY